ncbi:MAG TPA: hypothetical protein V6D22_13190 [Candidatus Obscuribacterales bacterium]
MQLRFFFSLLVAATCATSVASAADSDSKMTDAEKARTKAQIDSLKKQKLQAGQKQAQQTADTAKRDVDEVERRRQNLHAEIDQKRKMYDWKVGTERSKAAAAVHKKEVDEAANAEKAKIIEHARKKASAQHAAAKKNADNINESAEGLKSQVSKDGKFGLQPKGSSLHVRNYGK